MAMGASYPPRRKIFFKYMGTFSPIPVSIICHMRNLIILGLNSNINIGFFLDFVYISPRLVHCLPLYTDEKYLHWTLSTFNTHVSIAYELPARLSDCRRNRATHDFITDFIVIRHDFQWLHENWLHGDFIRILEWFREHCPTITLNGYPLDKM